MMKSLFFFILFGLSICLKAQVTLSVQLPPGGMIQKDQLWNLVAMNNGGSGVDALLLLSLQDVSTGQTVLTGSTRSIILPRGVKNIRAQDLQPVQYTYSAGFANENYIPLGAYTACYTISRIMAESQEPIATECVRINITPLSPPLLNLPANNSLLTTPYPQFSWIPPAPINMFSDLNYDLSVVEVLEGQSPMEAITNNSPVYARNFLQVSQENYATSYNPLEKNKIYAWQVTARNGMNYASVTDVWTFSLGSDPIKNILPDKNYIEMKFDGKEGSLHYLKSPVVRIKLHSYMGRYKNEFVFYDAAGSVIKKVSRDVSYGDNFFVFELDRNFQKNKSYRISMTDPKKNTSGISFIIQE
ncbi:MAG: hypothetical protein ABW007_12845 [Chitinophagaceae bacterium]